MVSCLFPWMRRSDQRDEKMLLGTKFFLSSHALEEGGKFETQSCCL